MVSLQNTGTMPVVISGVAISGADSADFQLAPLARMEMAPGQTELLEVTFIRTTAGTSVASLDVTAEVNGSPVRVPLNATATANVYVGDDDPDAVTNGGGGKDTPTGNGVDFGVVGEKIVLGLTVIPNPVQDGAMEVNYTVAHAGAVRLELVNATGAVVKSLERDNVAAGVEQCERFDVGSLGSGMYLLRVVTAEGVALRSVAVIR